MVHVVQDTWHGKAPMQSYEMANYWDTKFPVNLFGVASPAARERVALEQDEGELRQLQQLRLRRSLFLRR